MWNKAEAALTEALNTSGRPWTINEGGWVLVGKVGEWVHLLLFSCSAKCQMNFAQNFIQNFT